MYFFLRHLLPITYFQATRLNRWDLVAYNGLVEWVPAILLSVAAGGLQSEIFLKLVCSYIAFISLYEIGYLTNDYLSERRESTPRGRLERLRGMASPLSVTTLIVLRVGYFVIITVFLGLERDVTWLGFFGALVVTFALHNLVPSNSRTATFFSLSTFRFFAPILLTMPPAWITILLPVVLINGSLYRATVYLGNKTSEVDPDRKRPRSKILFYAGALPISVWLSIFFGSWLPIFANVYLMAVWACYAVIETLSGDNRKGAAERL